MSRLARTLVLAVALAAMSLVGTAAVAQVQTTDDDAVELFRRGERASQVQTTEDDAVELFRRGERASQVQTTEDAALQRLLAREPFSIPREMPAQVPASLPAEASGQPGWVVASLGVLAAVLALAGVLAARRASRKVRAGQPA
jgi:hypothetical protein